MHSLEFWSDDWILFIFAKYLARGKSSVARKTEVDPKIF